MQLRIAWTELSAKLHCIDHLLHQSETDDLNIKTKMKVKDKKVLKKILSNIRIQTFTHVSFPNMSAIYKNYQNQLTLWRSVFRNSFCPSDSSFTLEASAGNPASALPVAAEIRLRKSRLWVSEQRVSVVSFISARRWRSSSAYTPLDVICRHRKQHSSSVCQIGCVSHGNRFYFER